MNRRLVLKTIWESGAIHKAEIARLTELSLPTVMKITDELLASHLIRSCGKQEGAAGKRPEIYEFAGDRFYSIGIDFAPTVLRALVMDLNGAPVARGKREIEAPQKRPRGSCRAHRPDHCGKRSPRPSDSGNRRGNAGNS